MNVAFGLFAIWNFVVSLCDVNIGLFSKTKSEPVLRTDAPTSTPTVIPTLSSGDSSFVNASNSTKNIKKKPTVKHTIKFIPAPSLWSIPKKTTCKPSRNVAPGDTVFITIDDGPSLSGRKNLLQVFDEINAKVTFFESAYNLCGKETESEQTQRCSQTQYDSTLELLTLTAKAKHVIAAHSDTHFYNAKSSQCEYIYTSSQKKHDPNFDCGTDPTSDMALGAAKISTALMNDSILWEDNEIQLRDNAVNSVWNYARLPCTDVWRTSVVNYTHIDVSESALKANNVSPSDERAARTKIADNLYNGNVKCRPSNLAGVPWQTFGWDRLAEWRPMSVSDQHGIGNPNEDAEKCRLIKNIENAFGFQDRPNYRKGSTVVFLTHDYFFDTMEKATTLRDLMVELQLMGYKLDTIDNFKK